MDEFKIDREKNSLDRHGAKGIMDQLAEEISKNPTDWVLILGDGVSCAGAASHNRLIASLARRALRESRYLNKQELYRAVQLKDYVKMKELLFGNIWNGVSFLDAKSEEQARLREEYAGMLAKRERINTEDLSVCLDLYLRMFPGIILTTCQDETVEAFMEDESTMVIDGLVCTPYSMMTSPRWRKWRQAVFGGAMVTATDIALGTVQRNPRVLIKLYGSCQNANRMLLSGQDVDLYFPQNGENGGDSFMTAFLRELFISKNVFFLGMEPETAENGKRLPLPKAVLQYLEEAPANKRRFALIQDGQKSDPEEAELWKQYGITPLSKEEFKAEDFFEKKWFSKEMAQYHAQIWGQEYRTPDTLILGHDQSAAALSKLLKRYLARGPKAEDKRRAINVYGPRYAGKMALAKCSLELLQWKPENLYERNIKALTVELDLEKMEGDADAALSQIASLEDKRILLLNAVDQSRWDQAEKLLMHKNLLIIVTSREKLFADDMEYFPVSYLPRSGKAVIGNQETGVCEAGVTTVEELFWKLYIRRPCRKVSQREHSILRNIVVGFPEGAECKTKMREPSIEWNGPEVYVLAMIANNLADFYDLKKAFSSAKTELLSESRQWESPVEYCEEILWKVMNERLDQKSQSLYKVLAFYESDFPMEFLQLLENAADSNRKKALEIWKRSAIQLTNSGICVQQGNWKDIYRRIELADKIMETAGTKLNQEKLADTIREAKHILGNSYFYLSNIVCKEIKKRSGMDVYPKEKTLVVFKNLTNLLMEKSQGYYEIRSLLGTEMPEILGKMAQLEDKELDWKPELIYCLFQESPVMLRSHEADAKALLEELQKELEDKKRSSPQDMKWDRKIVMTLQTWSVIKSQSYETEIQEAALKKCDEAKALTEQYVPAESMPENMFEQCVQIFLQKARIYGRMSTIEEIARCRLRKKDCDAQRMNLQRMDENLKEAEARLEARNGSTGAGHKELQAKTDQLRGEYLFKTSQYLSENRRYASLERREAMTEISGEEIRYYTGAEKKYCSALIYYNRFPENYEVQRADVMRSLGDLYCRLAMDKNNDPYIIKKCYGMLIDAYALYRKHNNLRGIADVLQSRGNAERFDKESKEARKSPLAFYNIAKSIYDYLGDRWSYSVLMRFYTEAMETRISICGEDEVSRRRKQLRKRLLELEMQEVWEA